MNPNGAMEIFDTVGKYPDLTNRIQLLGGEPLFEGNYSKVYKGVFDGEFVAIKVLKHIPGKNGKAMERKMQREMGFWAEHKNYWVADFLGHARGPGFGQLGALVSPWYENGNSHTYLESRKQEFTFWDRIELFGRVVAGIDFLHREGLVHGDIKPLNVLIDERGYPKVCDFGLSRLFLDAPSSGLTTTSEHTGTERYLAPELLTPEPTLPTTASDVWALGCLGLEYMFGIIPYAHRPNNSRAFFILQDIKDGQLPYQKTSKTGLEDAVQELLHICWHRDHTRRPVARDILLLASLLVGFRKLFRTADLGHQSIAIYEMAYITRCLYFTQSEGIRLFVRADSKSELSRDGELGSRQGWREWALFQVIPRVVDETSLGVEHWVVREAYTGHKEDLLNPYGVRVVTLAGITQEYEAMRDRGESPFPISPVNRWPVHGQGSILPSVLVEAFSPYWY